MIILLIFYTNNNIMIIKKTRVTPFLISWISSRLVGRQTNSLHHLLPKMKGGPVLIWSEMTCFNKKNKTSPWPIAIIKLKGAFCQAWQFLSGFSIKVITFSYPMAFLYDISFNGCGRRHENGPTVLRPCIWRSSLYKRVDVVNYGWSLHKV